MTVNRPVLLVAVLCAWAGQASAFDLAQAYAVASQNDAQLRAAQASLDGRIELLPQAQSQFLPSVSLNLSRGRNELTTSGVNAFGAATKSKDRYYSYSKTLSIKQTLFNQDKRAGVRLAQGQVNEARAQFEQAKLALLERVGSRYIQWLMADEQLQLVRVQKQQTAATLTAAGELFAGGSGTRTDVDEAQASYDLALARELEAQQALSGARHELMAILDQEFPELAPVSMTAFERLPPLGGDLSAWLARAEAASPELRAAQARLAAAQASVERAEAGHWPSLDAAIQWSDSGSENVTSVSSVYQRSNISLQLAVPIYQGGYVTARVKQARAQQRQAREELEALRRDLGVRVHREFRLVEQGKLRVHALMQAQRSAQQAVVSAQRSQRAGLRSVIDVLDAQQSLASAQRDLAQARHDHLLARMRLQILAGDDAQAVLDDVNRVFLSND